MDRVPGCGTGAGKAVAALTIALTAASASAIFSENSFKPPFATFDSDGQRKIDSWKYGGTAELKQYFLRLTHDRQNKRGYVWNQNSLGHAEAWSSIVRMRVSGQGKKLFGDGLAMWFTTNPHYVEGQLHTFTDKFTGFGIIFDTYVNTDPGHVHRDVLFVTNDGAHSVVAEHGGTTDPNPIGCAADFRYWEGRADFSVDNHTAVRVTFRENRVWVDIDARGTNDWKPCVTEAAVAAPPDWFRGGAYLGFTASTGQLADNHDLLSVLVSPDNELPTPEDEGKIVLPEAISTGEERLDTAIHSVAVREAAIVSERLLYIHHSLEHQLTAVNDGLRAALKKLEAAEADNKRRIDELEKRVAGMVTNQVDVSIGSRIKTLEDYMTRSVDAKLQQEFMPNISSQLQSSSRTWMIALGALTLVVLLALAYFRQQVRKIMKTHLP